MALNLVLTDFNELVIFDPQKGALSWKAQRYNFIDFSETGIEYTILVVNGLF